MEQEKKKTHYNVVAGVLFLLAAVCECLAFLRPDGFSLISPWIPPSAFSHIIRLSTFLPAALSVLLAVGMLLGRKKVGKILIIIACLGVIIFSAMLYFLLYSENDMWDIAQAYRAFESYCMVLRPLQWLGYLLLAVIAVLALTGNINNVIRILCFVPALLKAIGYCGMRYIKNAFLWARGMKLHPKSFWFVCGIWAEVFVFLAILLGVAAMMFAGLALVRPVKEPFSQPKPIEPARQSISPQAAMDEIKKYKGLLDSGVISHEEYDEKKKQLLGL